MSNYLTEADDVQFSEPIMAQKGVKLKVNFAEATKWKSKVDDVEYEAMKLTLDIDDSSVKTEHADAKPRYTIIDQFNLSQFPYTDKKTGEIKKLGRSKLYQLEESFGFDPIFMVNGEKVEPFITRTGSKRAPKIEGVKRVLNPEFMDAYFNGNGSPKMENWAGKQLYANVGVETSEQFGDKNVIEAYVKAPSL